VHPLFQANMYLVEGTDRDMILDTGMGVAPLRPFLDRLRADRGKPLVCVSSPAHVDHIGGAHQFDDRGSTPPRPRTRPVPAATRC
jgi:glyoxylase-like metal-dependent hydrolase (beta-lactamase superfamily II)